VAWASGEIAFRIAKFETFATARNPDTLKELRAIGCRTMQWSSKRAWVCRRRKGSCAIDKTKGDVKAAIGKATDDKELRTEGQVDKAKGVGHKAIGDLKDVAKEARKHWSFRSRFTTFATGRPIRAASSLPRYNCRRLFVSKGLSRRCGLAVQRLHPQPSMMGEISDSG
jgi:uncharacterized protein YjbJ (UPF0337 family)